MIQNVRPTLGRQRQCSAGSILKVLVLKFSIIDRELYMISDTMQLIGLAKRGHAVTLITGRYGNSRITFPPAQSFSLKTVLVGKRVLLLSLLVFNLKAFLHTLRLESQDCAILDIHTLPMFLPMVLFRRLVSGMPVLFLRIESNPVETGSRLRGLLLSVMERFSITLAKHLCDRIFFITPMLGELYSIRYGIPPGKIAVWPSSVDTVQFDPSVNFSSSTDQLRRELGIADEIVVLYHGSLTRARGIMEAAEAFKILKDESTNVMLILLGYGPLREDLQRFVRENHLEKSVQICGPVYSMSEVRKYIALCDVSILPLPDHPWWRYQCFIKTLEVLAMNKPQIVTDLPASRWIIGNAPIAVYLKGTTPSEIAGGVRKFLDIKNSLHPELGRDIATKFSVDSVSMMLEDEIESVRNSHTD